MIEGIGRALRESLGFWGKVTILTAMAAVDTVAWALQQARERSRAKR